MLTDRELQQLRNDGRDDVADEIETLRAHRDSWAVLAEARGDEIVRLRAAAVALFIPSDSAARVALGEYRDERGQ